MCMRVQAVHVGDVHVHSMQHDAFAGPCDISMHRHGSSHQKRLLKLGAHFQVILCGLYAGGQMIGRPAALRTGVACQGGKAMLKDQKMARKL